SANSSPQPATAEFDIRCPPVDWFSPSKKAPKGAVFLVAAHPLTLTRREVAANADHLDLLQGAIDGKGDPVFLTEPDRVDPLVVAAQLLVVHVADLAGGTLGIRAALNLPPPFVILAHGRRGHSNMLVLVVEDPGLRI